MIARDHKGRASFGRIEVIIQTLIVANLLGFAIETMEGISGDLRHGLEILETLSVAVFTVEYVFRVLLSRPRLGYVFSFFGLIDLISTLPSLFAFGLDLRSLRVFRLFRLLRVFKLARHGPAVQRFRRAFQLAKEELALFGAVTLVVLYLAAVGIYQFEHDAQPEVFSSVFHSLWWATTTLTTVGYGDAYPITAGGRLFTFFVLVIGLGVVSIPTGLIASALTRAREEEKEARDRKES